MTTNAIAFDYTTVRDMPETTLRLQLLRQRLEKLHPIEPPAILEIGVGPGDLTLMLAQLTPHLTCIDCDQATIEHVAQRLHQHALTHVRLLEDFIETAQLRPHAYDAILLQNMLEHLADPVGILRQAAVALKPTGRLHISVPLADSLHRQLGVAMGQLDRPDDLAESDRHYGHCRVYNPALLREHLDAAGLDVAYELPFYLKPLPTAMLAELPLDLHHGLFALGQSFPQLAAYLYVEATPTPPADTPQGDTPHD